jgi:hypothetical protein
MLYIAGEMKGADFRKEFALDITICNPHDIRSPLSTYPLNKQTAEAPYSFSPPSPYKYVLTNRFFQCNFISDKFFCRILDAGHKVPLFAQNLDDLYKILERRFVQWLQVQ